MAHAKTRLVIEGPILENGITDGVNGFLTVQHTIHVARASLRICLAMGGLNCIESQELGDYNGFRS
jgi:hypothetical protein